MNLCIDQGNTRTKIGIFEQEKFVHHAVYDDFGVPEIETLRAQFTLDKCVLSTVRPTCPELLQHLRIHFSTFLQLDSHTKLPIANLYDTPATLGNDRIAAAVGANYLRPNQNLLIVDAGSAITYDVVNSQNQYEGGNIAPGLQIRLRALHEFTGKLPLVEISEETQATLVGKNTHEAITNGVLDGMRFELDGYIRNLMPKYPNLCVFLTGGNLNYFHNRLKSATFAEIFLVLIGLNRILEHNA